MSSTVARVRVFHAATFGRPVDIYIDDKKLISSLNYSQVSPYLTVNKGKHNIKIYDNGNGKLLYNQTIAIDGNKFITLSAISENQQLNLIVVEDLGSMERFGDITPIKNETTRNPQKTKLRFVHLSPDSPGVDLALNDDTILFNNTKYKQVTSYLPIGVGPKTLQIRPTGKENILLTIPNVNFQPDKVYTIYAIGLLNNDPKLDAIILTDGI